MIAHTHRTQSSLSLFQFLSHSLVQIVNAQSRYYFINQLETWER